MIKAQKTSVSRKKQSLTIPRIRVEKVNPDDPKLKPRWEGYEKYDAFIDSLDISGKMKHRLKRVARSVVETSKGVIEVGKKIIEAIIAASRKYPNTTASLIVGSMLSLLASHIPLVGWMLSSLFMGVTLCVTVVVFVGETFKLNILEMFSPLKDARRA